MSNSGSARRSCVRPASIKGWSSTRTRFIGMASGCYQWHRNEELCAGLPRGGEREISLQGGHPLAQRDRPFVHLFEPREIVGAAERKSLAVVCDRQVHAPIAN